MGILRFFLSILRIVKSAYFLMRDDHFKKIANTHRKAIILGNGPSLKNDFTIIKKVLSQNNNIDVFCVNNFPESHLFAEISPRFLVLTAPAFWSKDANGYYAEVRIRLITALQNRDSKTPLHILLPYFATKHPEVLKHYVDLKNCELSFYSVNQIPFRFCSDLLYRLNVAAPPLQNVLATSIYICISKNYEEVYFYGADHNWAKDISVSNTNQLLIGNEHFYSSKEFIPFPSDVTSKNNFTVADFFQAMSITFKSYETLQNLANKYKIKIINCSSTSWIDAFKRG